MSGRGRSCDGETLMLKMGLTGGIACGKSAVARYLRELGWPVLDADELAHELIEPGQEAYTEIVREFGPRILGAAGRIERGKLGAIVFADPAKLGRLNAIVHPRVEKAVSDWFANLERAGGPPVAVVEAALLIEAGYRDKLDRVILAWCRPEQQRERLTVRGLAPEDAERRIASQMPLEKKRELADEVIDCSRSLAETRQQVEELVERIKVPAL